MVGLRSCVRSPHFRRTAWIAGAAFACVPEAPAGPAPETGRLVASPEPGWPQWRGRRRDGLSDETGLLPAWPEGGPKLLWRADAVGRGYAAPVVTGGAIYIPGDVGGDLALFSLALDGNVRWTARNGAAWKKSYPGSRASCAYAGGFLYHMNAHGRVACFDAATGREVWAVDILQRFDGEVITWGLSECLLVDGPRVYVMPGGKKGLVAALDAKTGDTVWASEAVEGEKAGYASPILFEWGGHRVLVGCSSRHVFGVDVGAGRLLWRHPRPSRYEALCTTPVLCGDGVFVTTPDGYPGALYRLSIRDGAARAERAWETPLDTLHGGAVFLDGRLYGSGHTGLKGWAVLDARTGATRARYDGLAMGSVIGADGRLYCLSEQGEAALLKPSETGLSVSGRFRLTPEKKRDVWTHPVLCDGRLYLRYQETLSCFDVRGR